MADKLEAQILLPFEEKHILGDYREYFVSKRTNYFTTIHTFPNLWACYVALDEIWTREFSDLQRITQPGQMLPLKLFMNAHAQFRVAFELAFSTCIGEAWNIVRSSIEAAVQAHKIRRQPELALVWANKDHGKQEYEAYRNAFERKKKESLFPREHGLLELHQYYADYSELGAHPTISAMALRHSVTTDEKDVNWRHEYLDAHPERVAPFLLVMLNACALVEKAFFDSFSGRLNLDVELVKMREQFTLGKAQTAEWIMKKFDLTPGARPVVS
jgi:hypothetical protein